MTWAYIFGYVAILSGTLGALLYKKYNGMMKDAGAYRRLTHTRRDGVPHEQGLTSPEDMARAIEAIALEVERISEGQRFVTKLLAAKHRPDDYVSPPSLIPGLGTR